MTDSSYRLIADIPCNFHKVCHQAAATVTTKLNKNKVHHRHAFVWYKQQQNSGHVSTVHVLHTSRPRDATLTVGAACLASLVVGAVADMGAVVQGCRLMLWDCRAG